MPAAAPTINGNIDELLGDDSDAATTTDGVIDGRIVGSEIRI